MMFDARTSPPDLTTSPYKIHHIQYRSLTQILPYINVLDTNPSGGGPENSSSGRSPVIQIHAPTKPIAQVNNLERYGAGMTCPIDYIGKQRAIFMVTADLQSDIYYLVDPLSVYVTDVAYIPNYTVSVFMNSLFRNIKENRNLDAIEESDDEDDFYDMRADKYVDLTKEIRMECVYHKKFRRWIPYKLM
jgi:hypothetical protein